jgi:hypothetical protein
MGSMWALCGFVEKEDLKRIWRISMAFNKLVIWSWNKELFWRSVWCNTREDGIVGNVFVLVCYFNGKILKNFHVFCVNLFIRICKK